MGRGANAGDGGGVGETEERRPAGEGSSGVG